MIPMITSVTEVQAVKKIINGIEFNYQIMRLFDLIRIRYYTKYFI
jgi:phosphoenolpyruvate-protein kinase (PTS system EI component)